jgi:hypothetical protein
MMHFSIMKPLLLAFLFATLTPACALADSWDDPSVKEMFETSEVIGVFRVVEAGSFKARLIAVKVYKGKVDADIWLGGFSNKYGPIDSMAIGESYLLFINRVARHRNSFRSLSNSGNQTIAAAAAEAASFVYSQKNGYYVPTPTSGEYRVIEDKVVFDLAGVNNEIAAFPLQDIAGIVAHQSGRPTAKFIEHCKREIRKGKVSGNIYHLTNYLSVLNLISYRSFDPIFKQLASHTAWETRFTLSTLLGNVRGNDARDLLVAMLADTTGVVQGEVVRQLAKRESSSFLGPLLVKQVASASKDGLYPSLMSGVRNEFESGMVEIISTLANLKYKPAIPQLLSLLKTDDEYLFEETIDALIKLESKEYPAVLNDRLRDTALSPEIFFDIGRVIEIHRLTQCKEGLIAQLVNHKGTDDTRRLALTILVEVSGDDPTIEPKVLEHFNNFFTYYDTLDSRVQQEWLEAYLIACQTLKSEAARPLVYRALYDWNGLHPKVFNSVDVFTKFRNTQDSLRTAFSKVLSQEGCSVTEVIACGATGDSYYVAVEMTDDSITIERHTSMAKMLRIKEGQLFLKAAAGWCWLDCQQRFDKETSDSPINNFVKYAQACPNEADLQFLKALMASDRWEAQYFHDQLSTAVATIEVSLTRNGKL